MFGFKEINETNETRQNLTVTTKVTTKEKDRFELPPVESLPPIWEDEKKAIPALPDVSELPPIWNLPPVSELPPLPELK